MEWKGSETEHKVSVLDRHPTVSTFGQSESSTRDGIPRLPATPSLGGALTDYDKPVH